MGGEYRGGEFERVESIRVRGGCDVAIYKFIQTVYDMNLCEPNLCTYYKYARLVTRIEIYNESNTKINL